MTINGREYAVPEFDYNAVCDLDKYGVNIFSGEMPSPFILIRGVLALTLRSTALAGHELEKHIVNEGMDSLSAAFAEIAKAMEDSGFLAAVRKQGTRQKPAARKKAANPPAKAEQ